MLGTKKLSEIKQELRQMLEKTTQKLRSWLERRISAPPSKKCAECQGG